MSVNHDLIENGTTSQIAAAVDHTLYDEDLSSNGADWLLGLLQSASFLKRRDGTNVYLCLLPGVDDYSESEAAAASDAILLAFPNAAEDQEVMLTDLLVALAERLQCLDWVLALNAENPGVGNLALQHVQALSQCDVMRIVASKAIEEQSRSLRSNASEEPGS